MTIKVLIVDDSAVVRNILSCVLSSDPELVVVGTAPDPYIARDKILRYKPDVVTLDVEMPRMDGITFLKKLMKYYPIPVLIVSSLTQRGAATTLMALESGAVDIVAKPCIDIKEGLGLISSEIVEKVKIAATAKIRKAVELPAYEPLKAMGKALTESTNKVIAIGASTGGVEAVKELLMQMPTESPGIVVVQHMPEKFTKAFAERMNTLCAMEVREASDNDSVIPGRVLIAPGNHHMLLKRSGARYYVAINQESPVLHQRPSVDVLFNSVAAHAGANSVGIILTGMGADGARGLLGMKEAGARTIAQDESSCVVFGMPKEAIKLKATERVVPLKEIPRTALSMI